MEGQLFQVLAVEKKAKIEKVYFWKFTEDHAIFEKAEKIGTWDELDHQRRMTFDNHFHGTALIKPKKKDILAGTFTRDDGDTWSLTAQRLFVVAQWSHKAGNGRPGDLAFWSNGHLGAADGIATWSLNGNKLALYWPGSGAIDHVVISADGQSYRGTNEAGVKISGIRVSGN